MTVPSVPLILAIEPDRRQASKIAALAKGPLQAEVLIADTAERGLELVGERVPDLVLTSMLLSPKDESALHARLRELDAAGHYVQTLVIPVLGSTRRTRSKNGEGGLLKRLRGKPAAVDTDGCDPAVFATQITEYLERAAADRRAAELDREDALFNAQAQAEATTTATPAVEPAVFDRLVVEEQPVFDAPTILEEPVVLERSAANAPVAIEAPAFVEPPVFIETPVFVETPGFVETPVPVETPVFVETPVVIEAPVVVEAPMVVESAVVIEAPVVAEAPAVVETPVVVEAHPIDDTPIGGDADVLEEPVAVDSVTIPEPRSLLGLREAFARPLVATRGARQPLHVTEPVATSTVESDHRTAVEAVVEAPLPAGDGKATGALRTPPQDRTPRIVVNAALSPVPLWPRLGGASDLVLPRRRERSDPEIADFTAALDALNASLAIASMELVEPGLVVRGGLPDDDEPMTGAPEADSDLWMELPAGLLKPLPSMDAPSPMAPATAARAGTTPKEAAPKVAPTPVAAKAAATLPRFPALKIAAQKIAEQKVAAEKSAAEKSAAQKVIASKIEALKVAAPKAPVSKPAEKKPARVLPLSSIPRVMPPPVQSGAPAAPPAQAKTPDTPPLGTLLSSIKRDIQQLRAEAAPAPPAKPKPAASVKKTKGAAKPSIAVPKVSPAATPRAAAAPAAPEPIPATEPPPAAEAPKPKPQIPVQDEWGFFDPNQCGFAALLSKLDEITEKEEKPPKRRR